MKDEIYIVRYSAGCYDDYRVIDIFATFDKRKATKYVARFNRILKKWYLYYDQFTETRIGIPWIKDEHIEKYFERWYRIRDINKCFYEKIEVR